GFKAEREAHGQQDLQQDSGPEIPAMSGDARQQRQQHLPHDAGYRRGGGNVRRRCGGESAAHQDEPSSPPEGLPACFCCALCMAAAIFCCRVSSSCKECFLASRRCCRSCLTTASRCSRASKRCRACSAACRSSSCERHSALP